MHVRGLAAALNSSGKYKYKSPESVVDYLVVGGGVVGLAIAQRLAQRFPSKSTFLVERNSGAGQETSSRSSEVVHAGLYYPADSLKTRLCIRGRQLMYERCRDYNVPHNKLGKLVVALDSQRSYVEDLHAKAQKLSVHSSSPHNGEGIGVPTKLISGDEAREMEPDLSKEIAAALWSPETGIVDSHEFMKTLEKDISESDEGELVYSTQVVRVDPHTGTPHADGAPSSEVAEKGWIVQTVTGDAEESDAMLAKTLINATGLNANLIINSLLPREQRIPMYYARGSYASYHGPGASHVSHLIYPCPRTSGSKHAFQSLGTHLTLDLNGKIRFGPDLDWLNPPEIVINEDGTEHSDPDFWRKHLIPDESRLKLMHGAVREYLPGVSLEGLQPDYCGIRPKLVGPDGGFQDFIFRTDHPDTFRHGGGLRGGKGKAPMITLLGIESPGLTSSLAIAEMVVNSMLNEDDQ